MRNDPFFKFVALIVVAGVLIAIAAPNQPAATSGPAATTASAQPLPARVIDGAQ